MMKRKSILLLAALISMFGCSITTFAAPKTMPDGTVFDAEYYAEKYPDVKEAFGNDEKALYNHYVQYGKAEGRLPQAEGATSAEKKNATLVSTRNTNWGYAIDTYSDGSKVNRTLSCGAPFDKKYIILRTDYSDGLLDEDGNGIDDRDPCNSCGYTDKNYNCIADEAPDVEIIGIVCKESTYHKYDICQHGVVNGCSGGLCDAKECVEERAYISTLHAY